jgi:sulfate adenylyltransferase large subunit
MSSLRQDSLIQIEDHAANGAPTREPEVWDERIDAFNPLFDHSPEPSPVSTAQGFDMAGFLAEDHARDLLRFSTAGSVDDGKSTLIGRLLYDTQSVYEDNIRSIEGKGTTAPGVLDLALLTDGLRAEREQGITIDVAYRYFATARRKFIIADTPGHEQYTRNMATGASTASLAIVLVDARKGVLIQSRRHACITALLGVPHILVAVNKMDLVGYDEAVFTKIREDFTAFFDQLGELKPANLYFVPVSALTGDNVVHPTSAMPWYDGPSLLELLEQVPAADARTDAAFRMPVQRVLRPNLDFRGFAGQIAAGSIRPGDAVMALPSRRTSRVRSIVTFDGELAQAHAPQSVVLTLQDEVDISRGDLLVPPESPAITTTRFTASLVWMDEQPLALNRRFLLKHTSRTVPAQVAAVQYRLDVATLEHRPADTLTLNGIGVVEIATVQPLSVDTYGSSRITGSFVLIDPVTNATAAAGMIREATPWEATPTAPAALDLDRAEAIRQLRYAAEFFARTEPDSPVSRHLQRALSEQKSNE